jgi:hypothetical protein
LFSYLLNYYNGDRDKAIKAKSITFSEGLRKDIYDKDENGEL